VRLVFDVAGGPALNASLIDMGNRFRLVLNEVQALAPPQALPLLPVARVLWKPLPDMATAAAAWILAGGAHHTCYSQNLDAGLLQDFADIAGLECVHIGPDTRLPQLKKELQWSEVFYQVNRSF
ncbi:MAG: L-arabinose isomerase, partial [Adhaeribacter sp.]